MADRFAARWEAEAALGSVGIVLRKGKIAYDNWAGLAAETVEPLSDKRFDRILHTESCLVYSH